MRTLRAMAIVAGLACLPLGGSGCSPSAPPTEIKGMTPAEYREKQEQALGSPKDGSKAATAKPGRRSR